MIRLCFILCMIAVVMTCCLVKVIASEAYFDDYRFLEDTYPSKHTFHRFLGILPRICEEENVYNTSTTYVVAKFEVDSELKQPTTDWEDVSTTGNQSKFQQNLDLMMNETPTEKNFWQHYGEEGRAYCRDILMDYKHYYSLKNGIRFLIALGVAAPLANTSADMDIHNWYQRDIRSSGTDEFAKVCKVFGEGKYLLPIAGGLTLIAFASDEKLGWMDQVVGEYGKNLSRSYLVGGVPVLVMQAILGGDRPCNGDTHWTPFKYCHGVSGHSYMGATPFIMGAKMTDKIWLKVILYTCSTFPGWSRLNDGAHSLSQIGLGWFMAYMACDAVAETNHTRVTNYMVTPIFSGDQVGVNVMLKF